MCQLDYFCVPLFLKEKKRMEGPMCIAKTGSGEPCRNHAKYPDPAKADGVLIICGTHYKKVAEHVAKAANAIKTAMTTKARGRRIFVVNPAGNDNNAPAPQQQPEAAAAAAGRKDDDEMTEEELRADRRGSLPGAAKDATDETVEKGASKERLVDIVKIDKTFYVCNVPGSSMDKAGWKTFWEKHVGDAQPATCRIKDCVKKVKATGHMYWRDDKDGKVYNYLVPICSHHNNPANGYDWTGDDKTTNWQPCKLGFAVKIKESQSTKTHAYNLRQRKKK